MPAAETSRLRDWISPDDPYLASWPHRSINQAHGRSRYWARARSRQAAVGAAVTESALTSRAAFVNSLNDRGPGCHVDMPHSVPADPVSDHRFLVGSHHEAFHRLVGGIGRELGVNTHRLHQRHGEKQQDPLVAR